MAKRYQNTLAQAANNVGNAIDGATLTFYESGTSTLANTYSDNALTSANPNPVVADGNGRFGDIFLQAIDYRVVFKDASGTTIDDQDPYNGRDAASANAISVKDFGAVGDGVSDDTAFIQAAIDSLSTNGGALFFNQGTYLITDTLTGISNIKIFATPGTATILQTVAVKYIFDFDTKSNIQISGLILQGTGALDGHTNGEELIRLYKCSDVIINDKCLLKEGHGEAVLLVQESTDVFIDDIEINAFSFAGLQILGKCERVWFQDSIVQDSKVVTANSGTSYGVHISLGSVADGELYPDDVWILNNFVKDIPSWDGINTHGGERQYIVGNIVRNCSIPIDASLEDRNASSKMRDVHILNNDVSGATSDVGSTTISAGILVSGEGDTSKLAVNIQVNGNTVKDCATFKTTKEGGISINLATNTVVSNNIVRDCGFYGIRNKGDVTDFTWTGNVCINNATYGMYVGFGNIINGQITGNTLVDDGTGTYSQLYGIGGGSKGIRSVYDRNNFIDTATARYGDIGTTVWNKEFNSVKPNEGVWDIGDEVKSNVAMTDGDTTEWVCTQRFDKTLSANWSSGTTISMASTANLLAGDLIGVQLDDATDGEIYWSTIASITDATDLVVTDAFISLATSGNAIWIMRFVADRETTTFTPVISDAISGGNTAGGATSATGFATKVGELAHVTMRILNVDTTGMTAGNDVFIQAIPYMAAAGYSSQGTVITDNVTFTGYVSAQIAGGGTVVKLIESASGGGLDSIIVSELLSTFADLQIDITYRV